MPTDLYTLPHKALRLAVNDASRLLGAAEPATVTDVLEPVSGVLAELRSHAAHEDEFIEPLLARHLPDVALEIDRQHAHLTPTIEAVRRQLDTLAGPGEVAPGGPLGLYRAFQRMAAANLLHLDHEETVVMPALWATVPPQALADTMAAFSAAHPDAVLLFHRWPGALTPTERTGFGLAS